MLRGAEGCGRWRNPTRRNEARRTRLPLDVAGRVRDCPEVTEARWRGREAIDDTPTTLRRPEWLVSRRSAFSVVALRKARSEGRVRRGLPGTSHADRRVRGFPARAVDAGRIPSGKRRRAHILPPRARDTEMTDRPRSVKARSSVGVLAYRRGRHGLKVLLVHPAARSGETRTTERGLSRRANSKQRRLRSRRPAGNSTRNWARRHPSDRCGPWAKSGNVPASAWSPFTEKVNSIRQGSSAIRSNSRGRPVADASRHFRKSTAPTGSISTAKRRYSLARSNSSTGFPSSESDGWID